MLDCLRKPQWRTLILVVVNKQSTARSQISQNANFHYIYRGLSFFSHLCPSVLRLFQFLSPARLQGSALQRRSRGRSRRLWPGGGWECKTLQNLRGAPSWLTKTSRDNQFIADNRFIISNQQWPYFLSPKKVPVKENCRAAQTKWFDSDLKNSLIPWL